MEDPIACSPERMKNGLYQRKIIHNDCSPDCEYYAECLKECDVPNDYKFPNWKEVDATEEEIKHNICHFNWQENKLKVWKLS